MDNVLQEMANKAIQEKKETENVAIQETAIPEVAEVKEVVDEDNGAVIAGLEDDNVELSDDMLSSGNSTDIDSDIYDIADSLLTADIDRTGIDDEKMANISVDVKRKTAIYRKSLIVNAGMTVEEADKAAYNHALRLAGQAVEEYRTESIGVSVVIDKTKSEEVVNTYFTEDERSKLLTAKVINLKEVTSEDLKMIKIKKIGEGDTKINVLQRYNGSISSFSIPLPYSGEYATFEGAQTVQLSTLFIDKDSTMTMYEWLSRKAMVAYEHFISSTTVSKLDSTTKEVKLTFEEFANKFKYQDLDIMIFAILVASSIIENEATTQCPICKATYKHTYKMNSLLDFKKAPENYQTLFDIIFANKFNKDAIDKESDNVLGAVRYQSPLSENIFDVSHPSIAKALQIFETISVDDKNDIIQDYAGSLLYLDKIYVADGTGEYIEFDAEKELINCYQVLGKLPGVDHQIIDKCVNKVGDYIPQFTLYSKCTNCGKDIVEPLSVSDMVFHHAVDSKIEINM